MTEKSVSGLLQSSSCIITPQSLREADVLALAEASLYMRDYIFDNELKAIYDDPNMFAYRVAQELFVASGRILPVEKVKQLFHKDNFDSNKFPQIDERVTVMLSALDAAISTIGIGPKTMPLMLIKVELHKANTLLLRPQQASKLTSQSFSPNDANKALQPIVEPVDVESLNRERELRQKLRLEEATAQDAARRKAYRARFESEQEAERVRREKEEEVIRTREAMFTTRMGNGCCKWCGKRRSLVLRLLTGVNHPSCSNFIP